MFSVSQLNEIQIIVFGLIMLRMTAFVFSAAILNSPAIPIICKVLFGVVLTMMMYKSVATNVIVARVSEMPEQLIQLAIMELLIGVSLGFLTRLFFFAISMAGELISVAMGLGQGQLFNPMMGSMGNALEQFFTILSTLLYFSINGHHYLIDALVQSFQAVELARLSLNAAAFGSSTLLAQQFFIIGIKMSAPVLISMAVIQVGIGLLSRAVPQINVLSTSASITIALGFVILFISLPLMVFQMTGVLDLTTLELFKFIKAI